MASSLVTLASLLVQETAAQIYARGLNVAVSLGLPTTSWSAGDPTRSLYWFLANTGQALEANIVGFIQSGFLDYATGDWLTVLANELYNVQRNLATQATTSITLTNTGGGLYVIVPGQVVASWTDTSGNVWTYTNTTGGTLQPVGSASGATLSLSFTADVPGSAASAGIGAITTLVTNLIGVTITNTTQSVGTDGELDPALRTRCRAKLATLSSQGPTGIFDYAVRTPSLTGTTEVLRSRTIGNTGTGAVTTYVGGASGAVTSSAVALCQTAVNTYASALCQTCTVVNCTGTTIPVSYEIWVYASVGQTSTAIQASILTALQNWFAARPIGGDIIPPATTGTIYRSMIQSIIAGVFPNDTFDVVVTAPSGDTALAINAIALLGTVTPNVQILPSP